MSDEKSEEIKVKDRRRFNPDGSTRSDGDESPPTDVKAAEAPKESSKETQPPQRPPFEINFSTFVLSLASSVQMNLGLIPHPQTKQPHLDLVSAKQTIDIIGMMDEKTKGNLTKEEDHLIKQVLYELRVMYVEISQKLSQSKGK